ncbi:MAG: hypothetical protein OXN89_14655 [Bryobacterales bacterium]|nr:hypothetical protein [Bryobacterales bacterium]
MNTLLIATVLTGIGVLLGVWLIVDNASRDIRRRIDALKARLDGSASDDAGQ